MRVLMFGWEFPPYISGGLGTACYGMTQGLIQAGAEVVFVLPATPNAGNESNEKFKMKSASGTVIRDEAEKLFEVHSKSSLMENIRFHWVDSTMTPYATQTTYHEYMSQIQTDFDNTSYFSEKSVSEKTVYLKGGYGKDLIDEVYRYAKAASSIALGEEYDVIHAHDWMTYPAGVLSKQISGKPLIVHVHATEFDRTGEQVNQQVYDIERFGIQNADMIFAVSQRTKDIVVQRYGADPDKVKVVYNAVTKKEALTRYNVSPLMNDEKRVLFMGRITFQKGPEYFVEAARLVLEKMPNVRFIMAGSGDMKERMVKRASELRIGDRFHFPGFMKGESVDKMYALADLYVMPSVSEPFGIAPLEAMVYDTPVLLSKQSGVAEVLNNSLKVDFWDVKDIANKICAVLSYDKLNSTIIEKSRKELENISWFSCAQNIHSLYSSLAGV